MIFIFKTKIGVMACVLILCSGCGAQNSEISEIQEYFANASAITALVDVCADSGVIMDYSLAITRKDGECATTVIAPQDIAGITAMIRGDRADVIYEGAELEALLPPNAGFTPIDCTDGIMRTLAQDLPASLGNEKKLEIECILLEYEMQSGSQKAIKKVWLDSESYSPVFAEIYLEGDRILHITFTEFETQA